VNDTNTGLYRIGADHLGFSTGGVSRMNIDSSGRVNVSTTNLVTYGTRLQATGGVFNGDNVLDVRISSGAGPGGNGIWAAVYGSDAWGVFAEQEDAGVYGILGYHETGIGYAGVYGTDLGNASYWSGYFSGKLRVTDSISIGSSATRFGMQRVSLTAGGVLFSHPSASIGLSWDSLTNTLTVTNSTGQFYDLGLQRTNETAGFSSTANDTSGNLSLASGNSNGVHWYATAAAEGVAGPGFTFFGTGWSGNIQGIVIYWY
jgi:hypothetical protein